MHSDNTAPMSPELEAEVSKVRAVFDRVTNAVVDASNLRTEVNTLRNEVDILKRDTESLRSRNNELDVALADVRKQRDDANSLLSDTRNKLWETERDRDTFKADFENARGNNERLRETIERLTKERDDAIMASLQHEEAAKSANAKLEDIRGYASKVFGFADKPMEVPKFIGDTAGPVEGPMPEPFGAGGGGMSQPLQPEAPKPVEAPRQWWEDQRS